MAIQLLGGSTIINDATASTDDVVNGKIFYNNDGRQIGSANALTPIKRYHLTMESGTLTGDDSVSYRRMYVATDRSTKGNQYINISSSTWCTGYAVPESGSTLLNGYILKSVTLGPNIAENTYAVLTVRLLGSGNTTKRIYIGKNSVTNGEYAISFGSDSGILLSYTNGILAKVSTLITSQNLVSYSYIDIYIYLYKED